MAVPLGGQRAGMAFRLPMRTLHQDVFQRIARPAQVGGTPSAIDKFDRHWPRFINTMGDTQQSKTRGAPRHIPQLQQFKTGNCDFNSQCRTGSHILGGPIHLDVIDRRYRFQVPCIVSHHRHPRHGCCDDSGRNCRCREYPHPHVRQSSSSCCVHGTHSKCIDDNCLLDGK